MTPAHPSNDFEWKDYAPEVFRWDACTCSSQVILAGDLRGLTFVWMLLASVSTKAPPCLRSISAPSQTLQPRPCLPPTRRLRECFDVDAADYVAQLCSDRALRLLASPGKSGSIFFLSQDDRLVANVVALGEHCSKPHA